MLAKQFAEIQQGFLLFCCKATRARTYDCGLGGSRCDLPSVIDSPTQHTLGCRAGPTTVSSKGSATYCLVARAADDAERADQNNSAVPCTHCVTTVAANTCTCCYCTQKDHAYTSVPKTQHATASCSTTSPAPKITKWDTSNGAQHLEAVRTYLDV